VTELSAYKSKSQSENTELAAQLEEAESKISSLSKANSNLQAQLDEAKNELELENKVAYYVLDPRIIVYVCCLGQVRCCCKTEASSGRFG